MGLRLTELTSRARQAGEWFRATLPGQVVARALEVDARNRAVGMAGQTFIAVVPLLMAVISSLPWREGSNLSRRIIAYLELSGDAAEAVDVVFGGTAGRGGFTLIGVFIVLISFSSLAKSFQRVHETAWRLPQLGMRGRPPGVVATLLMLTLMLGVAAMGLSWPWWAVVPQFVVAFAAWWCIAWIVLVRRVPWSALLPGALCTAVAHVVMTWVTHVYVPRIMIGGVSRYGMAGVAFGVVSWLLIVSYVIVISAVVGAVLGERSLRAQAVRDRGDDGGGEDDAQPGQPAPAGDHDGATGEGGRHGRGELAPG